MELSEYMKALHIAAELEMKHLIDLQCQAAESDRRLRKYSTTPSAVLKLQYDSRLTAEQRAEIIELGKSKCRVM